MKVTKIFGNFPKRMKANEMKSGEMGVIVEYPIGGNYIGSVVLKIFENLVSLDDPNSTWDKVAQKYISVELLKPGDSVTLTQE